MNSKPRGTPREFQRIQTNWRISLPKAIRETLGWKVGDHVLLEVYRGRLIVENLSMVIKPPRERLK